MLIIDVDKYIIAPYGIFLALSIVVGLAVAAILLLKNKTNKSVVIFSVMINATLVVYGGLFFTYVVNMFTNKKGIGFTSSGGAIGIIVGSFIIYMVTKDKNIPKYYSLSIPLMYSISKLGCFSVGCCGGIEYEGFGAIRYVGSRDYLTEGYTFPIALVESIVFSAIVIVMLIIQRKVSLGSFLIINVVTSAVAKFLLDFLRISHKGMILTVNQISCIVLAVSVTVAVLVISSKNKSILQNRKN